MTRARIPGARVREVNSAPVKANAEYVLYWMGSARRLEWNFGLERAVAWSRELNRALLVFEPLRLGYPWASQRLHRFCLDGMREHSERLRGARAGYFPYVERRDGEREGLLQALAERAAVVVTDDFPAFFLPRMLEAAGRRIGVRLEAVDSNGIVPIREPDREFKTAHSFRRYLQKTLPTHLEEGPSAHPLVGDPLPELSPLSGTILSRWPPADLGELRDPQRLLSGLQVDSGVPAVSYRGGRNAARTRWEAFLADGIEGYAKGRRHPDRAVGSGLSPYLHWGHISPFEIVHGLLDAEAWNPVETAQRPADGRREGWWGLGDDAEAFLDQVITWRELGFNTAVRRDGHEAYESLPSWALETLSEHEDDPRPWVYEMHEFERAETHDPLWNAAQRELRQEGVIHNYLRMLWGKKILEWSPSPRGALDVMLHLNNRWGVDGRDPNSTSGIFWVLGRYDRGWPERPVFGKVRSMTSRSARRKIELDRYLARFGSLDGQPNTVDRTERN